MWSIDKKRHSKRIRKEKDETEGSGRMGICRISNWWKSWKWISREIRDVFNIFFTAEICLPWGSRTLRNLILGASNLLLTSNFNKGLTISSIRLSNVLRREDSNTPPFWFSQDRSTSEWAITSWHEIQTSHKISHYLEIHLCVRPTCHIKIFEIFKHFPRQTFCFSHVYGI